MIKVRIFRNKTDSYLDMFIDDDFAAVKGLLSETKGVEPFITGWSDDARSSIVAVNKDTVSSFRIYASSREIDRLADKYNKEIEDAKKKQQSRNQLTVPNSMKEGRP